MKSFSLVLLCLLFLFALAKPASAQQVWSLDTTGQINQASLDLEALDLLSIGDSFVLQVDESAEYPIQIEQIELMDNGDRSWYGAISNTGLDYALVITVGQQTAHVILTSPSGIFQLFGIRDAELFYTGPFNRLQHVRDEVTRTDTIVPEASTDTSNANIASVSGDFSISQQVSQQVAPVGSKLTFQLALKNTSRVRKSDVYVDIYFVLENTALEFLPSGCDILEYTDPLLPDMLLPLLSCAVGSFSPQEEKIFTYTVSTSEQSHPLVYSTATIGTSRSDVIVELFRDVLTDSDEDGISNYSEQILGRDQFNGLEEVSEESTVIDVLVAYTKEIDEVYLDETETRINQLFNVANKIFRDSETGIQLRAVGIHQVNYAPNEELLQDLSALTFQSEASLNDLNRMRSLYGGDLVVLFRTGEENGLCGIANLGGKGTNGDLSADYQKEFAFSVINIDCHDDSVLAHEVGHNMGLVHSRREDPEGGTFPYAAGHGVENRFVTVMAFPDDYKVEKRLYRFSDPERACGTESVQCGADKESTEGADAVSTLNTVKYQVANYFPSQEQRIRTIKSISNQSGEINAGLGIGAYSDRSSDFSRTFFTGEKISFRTKILPLPKHTELHFDTHLVLVHQRNYYQLTADGSIIPWDGLLKSLTPTRQRQTMGNSELFDVVKEVDFAKAGISGSVNVLVAYRIIETNELVYGKNPLSITINAIEPEFSDTFSLN